MGILHRRPGRIDDEGGEAQKNQHRLNPPVVFPRRAPETAVLKRNIDRGHSDSFEPKVGEAFKDSPQRVMNSRMGAN
jgi:hypothetical protein